MIRGGISDKLGNAYEALWLSLHILRVFSGRQGQSVTLEPLGVNGFEFTYETLDGIEWHQCKTRSTGGSWTINGLSTKGVLGDFKTRLTASDNTRCVFVSDTGVQAFSRLCQFAEMAQNIAAFGKMLAESEAAEADFASVCQAWSADEAQSYQWLRRCEASTVAAHNLDRLLRDLVDALFRCSPQTVVDRLAALGVEELTRRIDTDAARSLLLTGDIQSRDYAVNPTIGTRIDQATDRYLTTIQSTMPTLRIPRPDVAQSIVDWYEGGSLRALMVAGSAGAGKSHVLATAIEDLRCSGVRVLAFRADRHLECETVENLGEALVGDAVSPTTVLAQKEHNGSPVLLIDQLDAVSEASGRRGVAKDIILELVKKGELTANVKILLACRAYDLAGDSNLKALTNEADWQTLSLQSLDWDSEIAPALEEEGYDLSRFSADQVSLLSMPVHLATFLKLCPPGSPQEDFSSGGDLIVQLIEQTDRALAEAGESWSAWKALGCVAERMSRDQLLAVPSALLDSYRNSRNHLCSAGLLIESGNKIQFAHESYFDLIFARRFQASGQKFGDWLTNSEQNLFRRTQVRQILEYLRAEEPGGAYLSALEEALMGRNVRYLVKDAAARWLNEISAPTESELDIVLMVGDAAAPNQLMRRILGANWFAHIHTRGLIGTWLKSDDQDVRGFAMNSVSRAFELDSRGAANLIQKLLDSGVDHAQETALRIVRFARPGDVPEPLVSIYLDIINKFNVEALEEEVYHQASFYHWRKTHSEHAINLVAHCLERWLELDPQADPFIGDGMHENNAPYAFRELAEQNPSAFLRRIAPLYAQTLARIENGQTGHDGRHADRMFTKSFPRTERWGGLLASCLPWIAQNDPNALKIVFQHFSADRGAVDLHFILEAIASNGEVGAPVFSDLIDHPNLFDADHDGDEWLPTAKAALACRPYLEQADWLQFEARLFSYRPEHTRVVDALQLYAKEPDGRPNWRRYALAKMKDTGLTSWRIVCWIGPVFFSAERQKTIAEWSRKFDNRPWRQRGERSARTVVSPIPLENAKQMSDAAWLSAIAAYHTDDRNHFHNDEGDTIPGGASQLAGILEGLTKADPARFVSILERLPKDANSIYAQRILEGLKSNDIDTSLVARAYSAAQPFWNERLSASLGMLLQSVPEAAVHEPIFKEVVELAVNGVDPSRTSDDREGDIRSAVRIDDLFGRGSRAHFSGAGADRHVGWEALARIAARVSQRRDEIADLLDKRIKDEPNSDVLPSMADAAVSLVPLDKERAFNMLDRIARRDIRVIYEFTTPRIYNWLLWQDWDRFSWIVDEMLANGHDSLVALAHIWVAARYFDNGTMQDRFDAACEIEPLACRAAANVAHEYVNRDNPELRALDWLLTHADCEDLDVATQIFDANWAGLLDRGGKGLALAEALVDSRHFGKCSSQFIYALDDRATAHPDLALRAARRIISLAKKEDGDPGLSNREMSLHNLGKLVMGAADAYAERGTTNREALDLIDEFLTLDHYSVENELKRYDTR